MNIIIIRMKIIVKLIEAFINKKEWPVSGKAIIRFFDENQTVTHEFASGNK